MDRPLNNPPYPGSVHRFEIRFPGSLPQTIDYVDDDVIHLHISLRPSSEMIVLNDFTEGNWNRQVQFALPPIGAGEALKLAVHFGIDSLEIEAGRQRAILADRKGIVYEAGLLRSSQGVSLVGVLSEVPHVPDPAPASTAGPRRFAGAIDRCSEVLVRGWAVNLDRPESPLQVEILANGEVLGRALAHRMRRDLAQLHPDFAASGFLFRLPKPLEPTGADVAISVRVAGGQELAYSPWPVFRATPTELPLLQAAGDANLLKKSSREPV